MCVFVFYMNLVVCSFFYIYWLVVLIAVLFIFLCTTSLFDCSNTVIFLFSLANLTLWYCCFDTTTKSKCVYCLFLVVEYFSINMLKIPFLCVDKISKCIYGFITYCLLDLVALKEINWKKKKKTVSQCVFVGFQRKEGKIIV